MSYTSALKACGRAGEWQAALRLLREMADAGVAPNAFSYSAASEWVCAVVVGCCAHEGALWRRLQGVGHARFSSFFYTAPPWLLCTWRVNKSLLYSDVFARIVCASQMGCVTDNFEGILAFDVLVSKILMPQFYFAVIPKVRPPHASEDAVRFRQRRVCIFYFMRFSSNKTA